MTTDGDTGHPGIPLPAPEDHPAETFDAIEDCFIEWALSYNLEPDDQGTWLAFSEYLRHQYKGDGSWTPAA